MTHLSNPCIPASGSSGPDPGEAQPREASQKQPAPRPERGTGSLVFSALCRWGRSNPRSLWYLSRIAWNLWRANGRRRRRQARWDANGEGHIPTVLALSPTMKCNYHCQGCYSRDRAREDELTTAEIDSLLAEAEELGVMAVVLTGGEPLLREDIPELLARHSRLLFVLISNGSPITDTVARGLSRCGNAVVLVSIEGDAAATDRRRGPGAHRRALEALDALRSAGACFGFAATNTVENTPYLSGEEFLADMMARGCVVGFFSEYVPCGPQPHPEWVLDEPARAAFRRRVLEMRAAWPLMLVQFPQDEYGEENRCAAAGQASLHVGSQGQVEPCPFVPVACDNIRNGGLQAACRSAFLGSIRGHPELLRRQRYACSLFEHLEEIEELARTQPGVTEEEGRIKVPGSVLME